MTVSAVGPMTVRKKGGWMDLWSVDGGWMDSWILDWGLTSSWECGKSRLLEKQGYRHNVTLNVT